MSTDIEAAYAPFAEAKRRMGKDRAAAAARALALAVLEALAMYVIDEAVLEGVRARIAALGNAQTGRGGEK